MVESGIIFCYWWCSCMSGERVRILLLVIGLGRVVGGLEILICSLGCWSEGNLVCGG